MRARRLPGTDWPDILHEAIVRALDGTRRWPRGVPVLVFLAGCMRSIEHDLRRRQTYERLSRAQLSREHDPADREGSDPERAIAAAQALGAIVSLFSGDETVLRIIEGLGHGRSAAEIRARHGLSQTDYDSARKRLRRTLLRLDSDGGPR
ncbi:hypothetical protein VP06_31705 [Methylobacterium aquaticum]|uniref:Uncharacterized protein n=1 Tax=Methylobacterium aquaticum TaxID=270351 RepID=A0A0J6S0P6_9HYPH|nr:hypothetical protein VP06_31705 [Methylobacterium aquaticum]